MSKTKMRTVDMSVNIDDLENPKKSKKAVVEEVEETAEGDSPTGEKKSAKKPSRIRSKKYTSARAQVDRTKTYELKKATELLYKLSYSKFAGTIVADALLKTEKVAVEITFPYSTGKTQRVAVVTEELLEKIGKGEIDFDVLITKPEFMPKLAKFARLLGPKGLMPNPKNGTITPDPEKRSKELAGGKIAIKSEKKAPLLHVIVGKTSQKEAEIVANLEAMLKAIGAKKFKKLVISSTMSPGIKVDLTSYQTA